MQDDNCTYGTIYVGCGLVVTQDVLKNEGLGKEKASNW